MKGASTYHVRSALQEEIDGSANILIAVMKRYHALILILPSHLHQLEKEQHTLYSACVRDEKTQHSHWVPTSQEHQRC